MKEDNSILKENKAYNVGFQLGFRASKEEHEKEFKMFIHKFENGQSIEIDKLKKEIRALGLLCEGKELSKNILKKELEDYKNELFEWIKDKCKSYPSGCKDCYFYNDNKKKCVIKQKLKEKK